MQHYPARAGIRKSVGGAMRLYCAASRGRQLEQSTEQNLQVVWSRQREELEQASVPAGPDEVR